MISHFFDKYYKKSDFGRNVLTLMTGTTVAQAIPIAISPILTRLYTPDDFGVYALYISIVRVLSVIATGRYELAIMLPKKDKDAFYLLGLSIFLAFIVSLITLFIVFIFNSKIIYLLGNPDLEKWLYLIPVSIFLMGCYNALNYWKNRNAKYKKLARGRVIQSSSTAGTNVALGLVNFSGGLVLGSIIGQFAIVAYFFKYIEKKIKDIIPYSKGKLSYLYKRYSRFPKFEMFSSLSNTASAEIPIVLLTSFFSSTIVGFYSLSKRILSLPMGVLGNSIAQVFLQKSASIRNEKESLKNLTLSTLKKLVFIGIFPISIITVFGDYLFSFVFGTEWETAGIYAQIISIWLLFVFIASPLSSLLITLEKQKQSFIFNLTIFIARIVALCVGALIFKDAFITIILFTVIGTLFWFAFIFYILNLVKVNLLKVFYILILPLLSVNGILYLMRLIIEKIML